MDPANPVGPAARGADGASARGADGAGDRRAEGLAERLTGFVGALRGHGFLVGPGESAQAAEVLALLGLTDRERMRAGLAAVLLSGERQRSVYDAVFDLYFPLGVGAPTGRHAEQGAGPASAADSAADDSRTEPPVRSAAEERAQLAALRERLAEALAAGDQAVLARLAREAVDGFGRYGGGSTGSDGWSSHQTLGRLQPETLLARVLTAIRSARAAGASSAQDGGEGTGALAGDLAGQDFTARLEADEIRRLIESFRGEVRAEARRRVAERQGRERMARRVISGSVDEADFRLSDAKRRAELRRAVQPLARKLATRLAARRRRAARGTVDLRRSLRRSLSTGGVPLDLAHRRRRPSRSEIVLLCDVSGSVAGFAHFTMLLVKAMREQFGKVRVFAFVNRTDEVTRLVAETDDAEELGTRIFEEAQVTGYHGSSDYGSALGEFTTRYLRELTPRTSVLILGDARTNNADPNRPALATLAEHVRRVHWLNPEPVSLWGTGDSAALRYAELVDMHSCRNIRQLEALAARLLPV
ncbi:VWA domain-containing protein [Streptomyces physcomitrii]|uniref:VWA domain-containing protein n=1 Tax=Streptomyces physcomitrii TaxID=2724184 RepID=UPI003F4D3491